LNEDFDDQSIPLSQKLDALEDRVLVLENELSEVKKVLDLLTK
jgi:hypothetical protein